MARAYELEPREVDLVVEALTLYRDRRAEYVPGMRQKESLLTRLGQASV